MDAPNIGSTAHLERRDEVFRLLKAQPGFTVEGAEELMETALRSVCEALYALRIAPQFVGHEYLFLLAWEKLFARLGKLDSCLSPRAVANPV